MNTFVKQIHKILLSLIFLTTLSACVASEPKVIPLQYQDADYTATPLYTFENGEMELRYVDHDVIYGQVYDINKNPMYFNTIDLYQFDLNTKELEWKNYQKFVRIMDYMNDAEHTYYYEYTGTEEGSLASFYRFIDGLHDEKLYEELTLDLFNCPQFFRYQSSFFILSCKDENTITIRTPNENREIEIKYSYGDLGRCIVATAKLEGDDLYFEVVNEGSKSLYRINLTNGKYELVLKQPFDRFTITSSYIVLHDKNKEMVLNHDGKLLKTYEYDRNFQDARWTSKIKDDELIVTDAKNNMYYRDLDDDVCLRLSAEHDSIIQSIPVRFLTKEDSVIAQSDNTLYQITIHH